MYSCVSIWMNPQTLSQNYKSGVKDEFDLTGTNSKRWQRIEMGSVTQTNWNTSTQTTQSMDPLKLGYMKVLSIQGERN